MSGPLLQVEHLRRHFVSPGFLGRNRHVVRAVEDISFTVGAGETLGLVGESGSGKSTTGRLVLRLDRPTSGRVVFDGEDITHTPEHELVGVRRRMQVVFQDPYASLNPRMRVGDFVMEPLVIHGIGGGYDERRAMVETLFEQVGLSPRFVDRFPHQFSGGQRQRIGIARALSVHPKLIVADEPITALDVSIQAQIINLFQDLQEKTGVAYLFVAHDLGMVRHLCHRVAVMLNGRIVEMGATRDVFSHPRHKYTASLLSAAPIPVPALERARKRIAYAPEPVAEDAALREVGPGHWVLA